MIKVDCQRKCCSLWFSLVDAKLVVCLFDDFVLHVFDNSCGHCYTSSCRLSSILTKNLMSGSQRTLKIMLKTNQLLTKVFP